MKRVLIASGCLAMQALCVGTGLVLVTLEVVFQDAAKALGNAASRVLNLGDRFNDRLEKIAR